MSERQHFIVALASGLPRAFGVFAVLSGLVRIGTAVSCRQGAGTSWRAISAGARTTLAGALLSCEAMGAVYFAIAALSDRWADADAPAPDRPEPETDGPT
ncbi:hypothetical protein LGM43_09965 [Burkholderia seminalis]|uniref:hypothetical protein n=1 Tax=Burkholderia seminalis TaxID=488731 RepID=UPI001CF4DF4D|nr:hypothetical protein [Burkholderia seminalis]MCA7950600.1 hypothetical protein [Burkholderia seminalis]MDN7589652.1 hypothetical protein [Burkholderia seminalis]